MINRKAILQNFPRRFPFSLRRRGLIIRKTTQRDFTMDQNCTSSFSTSATSTSVCTSSKNQQKKIGIIGAGAAGIIAARWLKEQGHQVLIFEKAKEIGGVWKYQEEINIDASLYRSLRTNLPTSVMQLDEFPFDSSVRSFPSHQFVLEYLQEYAQHHQINELISLNHQVKKIVKSSSSSSLIYKWTLEIEEKTSENEILYKKEQVDKIICCDGHFATPFYAPINNLDLFKGQILHSHNYREVSTFNQNQVVVVIGKGPSGQDISLELMDTCKQVIVSYKEYNNTIPTSNEDDDPREKRIFRPPVAYISLEGQVVFQDGRSCQADVLLFSTGYLYTSMQLFDKKIRKHLSIKPIIKHLSLSQEQLKDVEQAIANGHLIAPLYQQVFPIEETDLAFIGLPFKTLPFRCFELQAKWITKVFSCSSLLPSKEKMYQEFTKQLVNSSEARKFFQLGGKLQKNYFEDLAMLSETQIDPTIHEMYMDTNQLRKMFPFDYREAEYFIDQQTGCWKRKIQVTDIMLKASHSSSSSSSTSCSTDVEKEITLPVQKLQDEDDQIVTFEIDEETQQRFLVRTF